MPTARAQRRSWPAVRASSRPAARAWLEALGAARAWLEALGGIAEALNAPRAAAAGELEEARELLAYWEQRARRLPRWALVRRREAREMAGRWRGRVRDAERLRYGRGVLGAASQLAVERRMPATVTHRGRQAVRVAGYAALTVAVSMALALVAAAVVVAEAALGAL